MTEFCCDDDEGRRGEKVSAREQRRRSGREGGRETTKDRLWGEQKDVPTPNDSKARSIVSSLILVRYLRARARARHNPNQQVFLRSFTLTKEKKQKAGLKNSPLSLRITIIPRFISLNKRSNPLLQLNH